MQQPEDEKAGNSKSGTQDGGGADDVYDFDGDPDDPNALDEFITDDKKIKGAGKRSQTVTVTFYHYFMRHRNIAISKIAIIRIYTFTLIGYSSPHV